MTSHPPFRKVFDGVATREQMFQLFNRHKGTPGIDPIPGTPCAGEYFEIAAEQYHFMLALLPPLFMRTGMFGMSEFKAGNVTSVFFAIRILRRSRKNARLAANLQRYLNLSSIEDAAERLADVPTRKLPEVARQTRARRQAGFDVWFKQQREADAGTDAAIAIEGSTS